MLDLTSFGARAGALEREGRLDEAEAVLRAALTESPGHPAASYALGIVLLRQERYAEGWPLYEARHLLAGSRPKPRLSFPEWRGEAVRSLLLLPEQGLGDQIMFARYAPLLQASGVDVTLGCSPSLVRFFEPLGVRLLPIEGAISLPRHDAWSLVGSLPRYLGVAPPTPLLRAPVGGTGFGLIATGAPLPDPGRSLDTATAATLLSRLSATSLLPEHTQAKDFKATAEIIERLEAVVTIDTSGAHLAASMAKPTYLMLPHRADWRWGLADRSPWYPEARLIRQAVAGGWEKVAEEVLRIPSM